MSDDDNKDLAFKSHGKYEKPSSDKKFIYKKGEDPNFNKSYGKKEDPEDYTFTTFRKHDKFPFSFYDFDNVDYKELIKNDEFRKAKERMEGYFARSQNPFDRT